MKKIILLPIILLLFTSLYGQDFAPLGAIWWGTPYSWAPPAAYYSLEVTKDTIVDGQAAKYLAYTRFFDNTATHIEGWLGRHHKVL